jgi:hypothetical protein
MTQTAPVQIDAEAGPKCATITDEALDSLRSLIGVPIAETVEPWCYEATRDNIRHHAHGIGDDNPLIQRSHAEKTQYGTLIAPPHLRLRTQPDPLRLRGSGRPIAGGQMIDVVLNTTPDYVRSVHAAFDVVIDGDRCPRRASTPDGAHSGHCASLRCSATWPRLQHGSRGGTGRDNNVAETVVDEYRVAPSPK